MEPWTYLRCSLPNYTPLKSVSSPTLNVWDSGSRLTRLPVTTSLPGCDVRRYTAIKPTGSVWFRVMQSAPTPEVT